MRQRSRADFQLMAAHRIGMPQKPDASRHLPAGPHRQQMPTFLVASRNMPPRRQLRGVHRAIADINFTPETLHLSDQFGMLLVGKGYWSRKWLQAGSSRSHQNHGTA